MKPAEKLRYLLESKGIYEEAIALMKEHNSSKDKSSYFYVEEHTEYEDMGDGHKQHVSWQVCTSAVGPFVDIDSKREADQYCKDLNSGKEKAPAWVLKAMKSKK